MVLVAENGKTYTEDNVLHVPVREYSISRHSPLLYSEGIPGTYQEFIDHCALTLVDKDAGRLLVSGPDQSGKSFFISEVIANYVCNYVPHGNLEDMAMIHLSIPESKKLSILLNESGSGAEEYPALVASTLGIEEEDIFIITEDVDFASVLSSSSTPARIILEVSENTCNVIEDMQDSGRTSVWSSWAFVSTSDILLTKNETIDFVTKVLQKKMSSGNSYPVRKSLVRSVVNFVKKNVPGVFLDDEESGVSKDDPLIGIPPTFFALVTRRAHLILSRKSASVDAHGSTDIKGAIHKAFLSYQSLIDYYVNPAGNSSQTSIDEVLELLGGEVTIREVDASNLPEGFREKSEGESAEQNLMKFKSMKTFEKRLLKTVLGQDEAVSQVATSLLSPAAGIQNPNRPLRTFLFLGPTGVGKTQLSLSIADELMEKPMHVVRLDMSEFSQQHADQKLFGTSPGYLGYNEEGGELTREVAAHPQSLVILDEVEKADPKIWDTFLQVFDAGRLTTGSGKVVDFSNTIIVMTSNLGAREMTRGKTGFITAVDPVLRKEDMRTAAMAEVENYFRPEFVNRIDDIVMFDKLDHGSAKRIIFKEIEEFSDRIKEQGKAISRPSQDVVDAILNMSDFEKYGARDIQRTINKMVATPLAKELLYSPKKKKFSLRLTDEGSVDLEARS